MGKRRGDHGAMEAILRHWQEKVPEDRLAHLVKDAWRSFMRILQIRLMEHSVSFGHWTFLRILWESDGLTQKELSEEAGVVEPTTHAALKTMEKWGYITRKKSPTNKKNVYVYLTKKGQDLKEVLIPLAIEINEVATEGIEDEDIAVTRRTLYRIISNCADFERKAAEQENTLPSTRELVRRISKKKKKTSKKKVRTNVARKTKKKSRS